MFDLFGSEMPMALKFFIAFVVVLALIGLTAWLVRRFGAGRLGGANARGRQPRLAVIDAATVDARRRLVLIRRDNVEHLLMIGGPTDVVVEPNIVRAAAAREMTREPPRGPERAAERMAERSAERVAEPAMRAAPPAENAWPLQPATEPAPRPYRSTSPTEEPWLAPEPGARPRPAENSLAGLAAELSTRLNPPETAPPVRTEPPARPSAPAVVAAEPAAAQADQNLAEMAQQLEAALRRTPMPEGRPPVTDALAAPAKPPAREFKARIEPKFEAKPEPLFEPKPEPKFEPKPEPKFESKFESKFEPNLEPKFDVKPEAKFEPKLEPKPAPVPGKTVYDNLEEEMASLLGRPSGKT